MMHEGDKVMNQEEFIREAWELRNSMLRLAYSIIREQHEAEDAVQESIVSAWRKLDSLKNEEAFKTWMMRIVINTCRSIQRKRKRYILKDSVELPLLQEDSARDELWESVCALEEKLRLPIVLHYYEGFAIEEIARIERRPVGTIATRMSRARKIMRDELNKKEGQV